MYQRALTGAGELNAPAQYMRISAFSPWLQWVLSSSSRGNEIYRLQYGDVVDLGPWGRSLFLTPYPAVEQSISSGSGNRLRSGATTPIAWNYAMGMFDFHDRYEALRAYIEPSRNIIIPVPQREQTGIGADILIGAFSAVPGTRRITIDGTFDDAATNYTVTRMGYNSELGSSPYGGGGIGTAKTGANDFSGTTNFAISLTREAIGWVIAWDHNGTARGPIQGAYYIRRSSTDGV